VFKDPRSFFHRYAVAVGSGGGETALEIWRTINGVNLRDNIQPTRERARLVLEKGGDTRYGGYAFGAPEGRRETEKSLSHGGTESTGNLLGLPRRETGALR
jgi:hypothetical protein